MKKKPPPGATLIARLKEQRLAREQALAEKKAQTDDGKPQTPANSVPVAASEVKTVETPAVQEPPKKLAAVIEVEQPTSGSISKRVERYRGGGDLIQREIDIGDLRPTSDDYFVLTDEIRLAGRFAAVGLIAQGLRLARLKDDNIYKDHYPTFEEYCRKEHHMSATYAYRLIRMSEMAERISEIESLPSAEKMPDPFEVMLGLGHRHLMALLPLELEKAADLLVKGIPLGGEVESGDKRVPISKATERQIRDALRGFGLGGERTGTTKVVAKSTLASEKNLIPALSKLVEMLEDWSLWLGGDPPPELEAARMGRGPLLTKLAKRFRTASQRIADALERGENSNQ
jgi:hypothetical protein